MNKVLLIMLSLLFVCGTASATVGVKVANTPVGTVTDINVPAGTATTFDGSTLTLDYSKGANERLSSGPVYVLSASNTILPAANIYKNGVFTTVTSGSYTLDTGANLNALVSSATTADTIQFMVTNNSAGVVTLVGNTGMTLGGSYTISALGNRTLFATFLSTNAWTVN